jgi:hypothetical protein
MVAAVPPSHLLRGPCSSTSAVDGHTHYRSMKAHPKNPSENTLPAGIAEPDLVAAITSSGYPLQGIVAAKLLPAFSITEEWGFIDDSTKEHRSLDIYAFRALADEKQSRRHTGLRVLIECKRSRHPFVFFQQVVSRGAPRFPHINGVPNGSVSIHEAQKGRLIEAWPALALGLDKLPFVAAGPPVCASFSKAIPSGKRVELSGTDPFSTIVLPLVKALRHTVGLSRAPQANDSIFPTLNLCLAVLDAPMIVVEAPDQAHEPVLRPWVRVVRHESTADSTPSARSRFYAIDMVHADFLSTFVSEHLLPFAEEFASRTATAENVLRYGGEVPNLDKWTWDEIKPRPKPTR